MLRPHEHVNEISYSMNNHEGLFKIIRVVLARLNVLDKQRVQSRLKSPHTVKKSWVRKVYHIHPLKKDGGSLPSLR